MHSIYSIFFSLKLHTSFPSIHTRHFGSYMNLKRDPMPKKGEIKSCKRLFYVIPDPYPNIQSGRPGKDHCLFPTTLL